MYKEGIGNIDIVWGEAGTGKGGYGSSHIIRRRNEEGYNGEEFVKQLPDIINNGKVIDRDKSLGRLYVLNNNKEVAIRLTWDNKERNWLVSAYILKP